jgi:hypothetical protein
MDEVLETEYQKSRKRVQTDVPIPPQERYRDLDRYVALSRERNVKLVLVSGPVHSAARTKDYSQCRESFQELCRERNLSCRDFSEAMPDSFFQPDLFHLRPQWLSSYRVMLDRVVAEVAGPSGAR